MDTKEMEIKVPSEWIGERLDKALPTIHEEWSRAQVQVWIQKGFVRINHKLKKGNYRLRSEDRIQLTLPPVEKMEIDAEKIPLDIRYEDADLLVVNKKAGMAVHPGPGHRSGTLVNALLGYKSEELSDMGGVERPGIVHRLDKDTSGLLMVAKNNWIHQMLANQLKEHQISRQYHAIVWGKVPHRYGTIDAPIGRDPKHRQQMAVELKHGKPAITHFTVQEYLENTTYLLCRLETGRTHQIRVHMKHIGFPIIGDPKYGPKRSFPIKRQALHAQRLQFQHPRSGETITIEAEPPPDFQAVVDLLRRK